MRFLFWRRDQRERDLAEELNAHLRMAQQEEIDRGKGGRTAAEAARREFGNFNLIEQTVRDQWAWRWVGDLWQDLRHGARALRKNPAFAVVAILTLALGIGANTAIFSVVNGVLLSAVPFPHAEQLVTLHESKPNFDAGSISYPNFRDWQRENRSFSSIAVTRGNSMNLTGLGEAEQLRVEFVSSEFFSLLGVKPSAGRFFATGEDEIGRAPIVLISAGFWKRKFGSSPEAIGKTLRLDGKQYTIVGVVPEDFDLVTGAFRPAAVYLPIGQWGNPSLTSRSAGLGIHGFGRLKPGVSIDQARADMQHVTNDLAAAYPEANKGIGATLVPLRKDMVGQLRPMLLVLLAAVGFVLLIACVNVANLLLARSHARMREFAVRVALGAGRSRIVRQLVTESTLLALVGGAAGVLLAVWCTKGVLQRLSESLPRLRGTAMDSHVLLFTLGISLFCGILFGLVPALKSSLPNLQRTLKEGGRGGSGARQGAQAAFVVAEVSMALVLLIASGLMVRSLVALWNVDPGFNPHNVLTCGIALSPSVGGKGPAAVRAGLRDVVREVEALPNAKAVSLSWAATPMDSEDDNQFWLDGQPKPQNQNDMNWAVYYVVQEDYLRVMGIPLEHGRFFTSQDNENSRFVVVVDDVLAKKFFGDQDPVGKLIHLNNEGIAAEIVGVVGHVKQWGLDSDDANPLRAQLYFPYMQLPEIPMTLSWNGTGLLVRFEGPPEAMAASIRQKITRTNGEQVMFGVQTMDEIVARSLSARRYSMILLGVFAVVALALACMGIYGVISYLVGQRTQEIGIRMALGAQRRQVIRLVLREGMKMVVVGVAIGLAAAFGLTRLMANLLYGVGATDPVVFLSVASLLGLVAFVACYIPARRATRVDPMTALRYE